MITSRSSIRIAEVTVKEQENIKEAQRKLDVRSHCREQILYMIGQSAPDHILEDMLIRHDRTSLEKKKYNYIPCLMQNHPVVGVKGLSNPYNTLCFFYYSTVYCSIIINIIYIHTTVC